MTEEQDKVEAARWDRITIHNHLEPAESRKWRRYPASISRVDREITGENGHYLLVFRATISCEGNIGVNAGDEVQWASLSGFAMTPSYPDDNLGADEVPVNWVFDFAVTTEVEF